jgi:hypothetical protein
MDVDGVLLGPLGIEHDEQHVARLHRSCEPRME